MAAAWLVTFSFIIDNYWSANASLQKVEQIITKRVQSPERQMSAVISDTSFLQSLQTGEIPQERLEECMKKDFFIFFYAQNAGLPADLLFWNTNIILPDSAILASAAKEGFRKLSNGYYVWHKVNVHSLIAVSLIPVKWDYIISNEYLQNTFTAATPITHNYNIETDTLKGAVIRANNGKALFSIVQKQKNDDYRNTGLSIVLRLLATFLVLLMLHNLASFIATNFSIYKGTLFLLLMILILRSLSYYLPIPLNFRQFELFDPSVYASSGLLRSLGDLLINAILFFWIMNFIRVHLYGLKDPKPVVVRQKFLKWLLMALPAAVILLATFTSSEIIRSLVADSQISFDVVNFFSLSVYSVIGFFILCCVALGYYFLSQVILYLHQKLFPGELNSFFVVFSILALSYLSLRIGKLTGGYELFLILWVILFLYIMLSNKINYITSRFVPSRMVFWLCFFSISITAVIVMENADKELRNRKHYAQILATKTDPASEVLINTMLTDFRSVYFAQNFSRFKNKNDYEYFKDSLVKNNFSSYRNKYDTKIYAFDENLHPLAFDEPVTYNQLNAILNTQAKPTGIPGLYYFDESLAQFSYIAKRTVLDTADKKIGEVFLVVTPRNNGVQTLYPELFGKGLDNSIENSSVYAYAVYNKEKLISSHNDYPFATKPPDRYFGNYNFLSIKGKENHSELWYNAGGDKYVVIAKENSLSIESITLFSYLFCGFLILSALFWVINIFRISGLHLNKILSHINLNIRNQIHGTILFISILSFFVIGIATILFFINKYESNNREKLSNTIKLVEKEINRSISNGWQMNDTLSMGQEEQFDQTIKRMADIHGVDVNLYDLSGNLKFSSLPLPYVKGIVSNKMEPQAYYHLHNEKEILYFQTEKIGKLRYLSNYVPVLGADGREYAYLNIPYFTSESRLKQEISNFLVTIINLNAFIFLIAGIVSLFLTNRITNSFSLISEKMKKIHLGTRNEPIEWIGKDEIKDLVNEYNKMVEKLDASAAELAKTEREGAWKEMARQVAHEIKNPLTPMKLSLQFLQRSIENKSSNINELAGNMAKTLVEQINHLTTIANEFSEFANLENTRKEKIDLHEALRSLRNLYLGNDEASLLWQIPEYPAWVYADKTHINRLFTNLILNALQAVPAGIQPKIEITSVLDLQKVTIRVKDNGKGITEEARAKIFTPNFTTKTSGAGLGLAMCKRIVEHSNGIIYFETTAGMGTIFTIEFPLYEETE